MPLRKRAPTRLLATISLLACAAAALGTSACDGGDTSSGGGGTTSNGGTGGGGTAGTSGTGAAPIACDPAPTDVVATATGAVLQVAGDTGSTEGIFDPSLVYPLGAPAGAMSYSSVAAFNAIHTRIAVSADQGAKWIMIADANISGPLTIPSSDAADCPGGTCTGSLVHEVSSLAFDPDDPDPDARWKLFVHRYLVLPTKLRYDYGHIALQTAPAPEGPWSEGTVAVGWSSTSPYSSDGAALLTGDVPELSDCLLMTEPAALVVPGQGLDLALGCGSFNNGEIEIRIVLLRSVDHGATFQFVSTLLAAADADCLGSTVPQVNAASLFLAGGNEYLFATPAGSAGYRGCHLFRLGDPAKGQLLRDASGLPVALRRIDIDTQGFTGACAFAEGATAAGALVPWAEVQGTMRTFRILTPGLTMP